MIVSLLSKSAISSITLPDKIRGKFAIPAGNGATIDIEGIDENWILKSNKKVKILESNKQFADECILTDMSIYNLQIKGSKDKNFIFSEPSTDDRVELKKYLVSGDIVLNIGRNDDNQIVIKNEYVSGVHARIIFKGGKWIIKDQNSSNGTYVNGKRIEQCELNIGDVIYIMGVLIVIGNRLLAINNPDKKVRIGTPKLIEYIPQTPESEEEFDFDDIEDELFYRSPRFKRDIETRTFKIDSPPNSQVGDEMPIMMAIGPSLTMGMASMVTAVYGIQQGNFMSAITSGCMLLGTVLWPIISKKYEGKRKKKKEALRVEKYKEYLERIKKSFIEETEKQREIILENNIDNEECESRVIHGSRNLWERSLGQNDFLKLNVGIGNVPLDADIQYPERKFEIERDELEEELLNFCEEPHLVNDVPVNISLLENNVTGVIGDRKRVIDFVHSMTLQLSTLYSYDEVKLVFIYDEKTDGKALNYVKWLPHIWNDDKTFRFLAKNIDDIKELSSYLKLEFEARSEIKKDEIKDKKPYYVIFAFSKEFALRADILKSIYESKDNLQFSVVTAYDELKNLPKECSNVVDLNGNTARIYDKNDISGNHIEFIPNLYKGNKLNQLSISLANTKLDIGESDYVLPKMITFLEMFNVGKIEHLNILSRWKENDPTKTLEAQVGVDTIGDSFKLDLHEKYHGPHGLVAGMTGSGKSEFIMTYILSLSINYHPDELSFLLIDYKGGGMAKTFETLPHTAGIITNLDGAAIKRSLISIQSELKRRQAIFAQASKASGISNIDIYKYQKMYREGTVDEPLQHLFIISDEFAELKTQQPDFMTQLVSAARIGRSLGIHLILATQKPSGVVDDQIWSNAKFKACLKVQDKADSMDMLKRPEAAELQETGRFYLQVGYNELFKLGQSAWSGAPYYPSDKVETQTDESIDIIDNVGRIIATAKMKRERSISKPKKQVDAITEYLAELAAQENIKVRPLWLDPIPDTIYVEDLERKYNYSKEENMINPVIGEYDDPMNQSQNVLTLSLTEQGNAVIYGMAGSGKTTFVTTMIYSLLKNHSPQELNLYILDFASETLTAFSKAPHVGDVVLAHETEKVTNLIKLMLGQIQTRKKLFADFGGDIVSYNKNASEKVPAIVIVINNYAAFSEMYEDYENEILNLTREGTKYGIYFVLTATGTNAVRFRILQNLGQSYVLQLTDETDYSGILGKTDGLVPSKFKGRGLCKKDEIYEFQTAYPFESNNQFADIKKFCDSLGSKYTEQGARNIPVLPEKVNMDFIERYIKESSLTVPIGVETASLEVNYYDFSKNNISFIQSETNEYVEFSSMLIKILSEKANIEIVVFDPDNAISHSDSAKYFNSKNDNIDGINTLFTTVLDRHNAIKDAEDKGIEIPDYSLCVYLFSSLNSLKEILDDEGNEKLGLILEKCSDKMNIKMIIAESSKGISSYNFEKWFKNNASSNDAIWVGNGITDQYYLKIGKTTPEMNEELSDEFGFAVNKGKAVKIKLINDGEVE